MNKRICIVKNSSKSEAIEAEKIISDYFKDKEVEVFSFDALEKNKDYGKKLSETALGIVLGGDGTIIQAANELSKFSIPIFGINLGNVGFLTQIEFSGIKPALDELYKVLVDTNFSLTDKSEKRMMLATYINGERKEDALNEVVITRNGFLKVIEIFVYINDVLTYSFIGDGIIVATPTGSTGYNFSAGGSVVKPDSQMILITPVCAHSMNVRSLVVSPDDEIRLEIGSSKKPLLNETAVMIDAQRAYPVYLNDKVVIKKSDLNTKILKLNNKSFYRILNEKLMGGC